MTTPRRHDFTPTALRRVRKGITRARCGRRVSPSIRPHAKRCEGCIDEEKRSGPVAEPVPLFV